MGKGMVQKAVRLSLFFIFFLSILFGCVDFSTYSDANEVLDIYIGEISSDGIVLHKEEIVSGGEGQIILTLKGKLEEDMPLKIGAEFELSDKSKILYAEKYHEFTFHTVQDSFSFQVVAQSGLPKKWTLKLRDGRSGAASMEHFKIVSWKMAKPCEGIISEEVSLYKRRDTSLAVVFVNTSSDSIFPIEIVPEIQLAENSFFVDYIPGTVLRFENLLSVNHIKIEAENRGISDWKIVLKTPDSDDANLKGGKYIWISDAVEISDTDFVIDTANANAVVRIEKVNDWDNFSTLLQYTLNLPLGGRMEFLEDHPDFDARKVIFNTVNDIRRFKIVSQSGREKIWKIKLDYAYNRKGKVETFNYLSYRPEESVNISLNPLNYLDTLASAIYIDVNEGVKNITNETPLAIFPVMKLTDKASVKGEGVIYDKGMYKLPEVVFTSIHDVYHFKIYTESHEEKEWKIVLRDKQKEKSGEAVLTKFIINREQITDNVEFSDNIFVPVAGTQEILLSVKRAKFPLLLDVGTYDLTVSEGAKVVGGKKVLTFESPADKKTFRVEAANGTEKVWTIGLTYNISDMIGVTSVTIHQIFPDVVRFEKDAAIDAEQKRITLNVMDATVYFPLRFGVTVTLPDKVKADKDLSNLTFLKLEDVVRFHLIAESGRTDEWTIVINNRNQVSDEALLKVFHSAGLTEGIVLGNSQMESDKIRVTVTGGKKNFPLLLDISQCEKSEGANLDKEVLTFDHIGKSEVFNVISQSGNIRRPYTVLLVDKVPLSDSAEIRSFKLIGYSPLGYQLSGNVDIDNGQVWIEIYGRVTDVPLIIRPSLRLSGGAKLQDKIPDNGLELRSGTSATLTVVSESGRTKDWRVALKEVDSPQNSEALIKNAEVSKIDNNIEVKTGIVDKNIVLYVGNVQVNYPLNATLMLNISDQAAVTVNSENSRVRKLSSAQTRGSINSFTYELVLAFNRGESKQITVVSQDGTVRNVYTISLGGIKTPGSQANVEDISISRFFPMNITRPDAWADAETGEVIISAPADVVFPFTIYPVIRLSQGAKLAGDINLSELVFDKGTTEKTFKVIAENGTAKEWKLKMKIAEKSNKNDVTGFVIKSYTPLAAGLGVPKIDKNLKIISIPVADWQKGERLNMEVGTLELSAKATSDFRASLFFLTPKDEYIFNVTAENGDKAEWKVRLNYTFSTLADITGFKVLSGVPSSVQYNPNAIIYAKEGIIEIEVLHNLVFPFTIQAEMAFSPKSEADLLNIPDNRIRFNTYMDATVIRVTAEDGTTRKDWKVKLKYNFSSAAEITTFALTAHSPAAVRLEESAVEIVPAEQTVWIKIADWNGQTELKVTPQIAVSDKAAHNLTGDLLFIKKDGEIKTIIVRAESGEEKSWKVKLKYVESSAAEITEFKYTGTEPATVDFLKVEMNPANAQIILRIAAWNGETQMKMSGITYKVSDKATVSIPSELTFVKFYGESFTYKVKAQDGSEKIWTIKLAYNESSAAEITRFRITGNNQLNIIKMANEGKLGENTVEIELTGGVRDAFASYFEINVDVVVSDKATHNIPSSIKFMRVGDEKKFVVTAESGLPKEWVVRFVNNAPNGADLLAVRGASVASAPSGDLQIADLRLDGNVIRFNIIDLITTSKYGNTWPTLDIDLDLQLSAGAAVTSGGSKTRVSVKLDNAQKSGFKVVADNGVSQNAYEIEPVYRPQFDNWNMDTWRDDYTPGASGSVWGTANTSMAGVDVKGTRKTGGKSGSAALMYTTKTMGTIASGTIFAGKFVKGSLSDALNDPEKMTHFGVPFAGKPKRIRVDVQYKIGNGSDKAHIWAALEYWPNPGDAKNPNNKRYAYGEVVLSSHVNGWTSYTIDLGVVNAGVTPTHILFVAASSKEGNKFIGAEGSELRIDNVEVLYE